MGGRLTQYNEVRKLKTKVKNEAKKVDASYQYNSAEYPVYHFKNILTQVKEPKNNNFQLMGLPIKITIDLTKAELRPGDGDLLEFIRSKADAKISELKKAIEKAWKDASDVMAVAAVEVKTGSLKDSTVKEQLVHMKSQWLKANKTFKEGMEAAYDAAEETAKNALTEKLGIRAAAAEYNREVAFSAVMGIGGAAVGIFSIATSPFAGPATIIAGIAAAKALVDSYRTLRVAFKDTGKYMVEISNSVDDFLGKYKSNIVSKRLAGWSDLSDEDQRRLLNMTPDQINRERVSTEVLDSTKEVINAFFPTWFKTMDALKGKVNNTLRKKISGVDVSASNAYVDVNNILDSQAIAVKVLIEWKKNNVGRLEEANVKDTYEKLEEEVENTGKKLLEGMKEVRKLTKEVKGLWAEYQTVKAKFDVIDSSRSPVAQIFNAVTRITAAGTFIVVGQVDSITSGNYESVAKMIGGDTDCVASGIGMILGAGGDLYGAYDSIKSCVEDITEAVDGEKVTIDI